MTIRLLGFAVLCAAALAPLRASAAEDARVEAAMTYRGAVVKLDHVLVVRQGDEEGLADGPRLRIFLSDRDIPLGVAGAASTLTARRFALQAGVNGVMILADPAGRALSAEVHVLNMAGLAADTSLSLQKTDAFSRLQISSGRAAGTLAIDEDDSQLSAAFDAPVTANPVTADLKGAAALASAPAQAVLACTRALHTGDFAAMARVSTAARMQAMAQFRAQVGDLAFRDGARSEPGAGAVARTITRVVVRGSDASVLMTGGSVAGLVREEDGWKCD